MTINKKTLSFLVKILIGILSFWIIYNRLNQIPQLKQQCELLLNDKAIYFTLLVILLLMLANWGIESYKWQLITRKVQLVSYSVALKSVFSGICVGNIAPGRAMEFLAKIIFFKPENRPSITVLHFINGMFQMLITVTVGIVAIAFKLNQTSESSRFIYFVLAAGLCLILFFCWAIFNVSFIQRKLKFIKWFKKIGDAQHIQLSKTLILKLITLSIVRYCVFSLQFYLIYTALAPQPNTLNVFASIAAYFMLTSLIPMISVIEPAIRAAIALFVFNNVADHTVTVVLASTFIWIVNAIIPSIIGYIIILKEKIDFRSAGAN